MIVRCRTCGSELAADRTVLLQHHRDGSHTVYPLMSWRRPRRALRLLLLSIVVALLTYAGALVWPALIADDELALFATCSWALIVGLGAAGYWQERGR